MAKILLVEDDKSLREIYGVRLQAEGYTIVSAGDGEEALAMAIKERPDLIVSDVMMPKISGFDMLDILRSTTETKDVKVIMMTALSSEDQRARGESLGADRYLVKSQVGIEDVVRTVHDVLSDGAAAAPAPAPSFPAATPEPVAPAGLVIPEPDTDGNLVVIPESAPLTAEPIGPAPQAFAPQPVAQPAPAPAPVAVAPEPVAAAPAPDPIAAPVDPVAAPIVTDTPVADPVAPVAADPTVAAPNPFDQLAPAPTAESTYAPEPVSVAPAAPVAEPAPAPTPAPQPVAPAPVEQPAFPPQPAPVAEVPAPSAPMPEPTAPFSTPAPASLGERVIQPLTNQADAQTPTDISSQLTQALEDQVPSIAQPPLPPTPPAQ